jgi:hypothetical protein
VARDVEPYPPRTYADPLTGRIEDALYHLIFTNANMRGAPYFRSPGRF